jgi:hypothetical protein
VAPIITALPRDVVPGETIQVPVEINTPEEPGRYILVIELFDEELSWFSEKGVVPLLVQTDVEPLTTRSVNRIDLSAIYQRKANSDALTMAVPRLDLWNAALRMFMAHPLGIGPDNFRLEYGKYLYASRWNTSLYANNLYLELLTGSGLLGLAAFGLILAVRTWRVEPMSLAVAVFLVHGLVDYFLMTTPIYFAFWILLGSNPTGVERGLKPATTNSR